MKRYNMIRGNKGSSLVLVLVMVAFIGILSSMLLTIAAANLQMKSVNKDAKGNFYSAEAVMNELKAGLEEIAAEQVTEAYRHILENYVEIKSHPDMPEKDVFDQYYVNGMIKKLTGVEDGTKYDIDLIKSYVSPAFRSSILNRSTDINLLESVIDTTNPDGRRYIRLKDIKIGYADSVYETTITTDILIEAPAVSFSNGSVSGSEFMKYALIGDKKVAVTAGNNARIQGSIYAGADGFEVSVPLAEAGTNNITVNGDYLISRGDLAISTGAAAEIGTPGRPVNMWVENIVTKKKIPSGNLDTILSVVGNCYVSDDLVLSAKNSKVSVAGNYYGYNMNKSNTIGGEENSQYSSAILINGRNSSLDLSNVSRLVVSGRGFVSRSAERTPGTAKDIMMGESITVKSNQIAYLVPSEYLEPGRNPVIVKPGDPAPKTGREVLRKAIAEGKIDSEVLNLLSTNQVTAYYCPDTVDIESGNTFVYYYYEFKNMKCANEYFENYYDGEGNAGFLDDKASAYVSPLGKGIKLNPSSSPMFGANVFGVTGNPSTNKVSSSLNGATVDPDNPGDAVLQDARYKAMEYKARQLSLQSSISGMSESDIRLDDKTSDPLIKQIIVYNGDQSQIAKEISEDAVENGFTNIDGWYVKKVPIYLEGDPSNADAFVYLVHGASGSLQTSKLAELGEGTLKGILVADGSVDVNMDFQGLIISSGTITLSANNVKVQSDDSLVQKIFKYGVEKESAASVAAAEKFTHYFVNFTVDTPNTGNLDEQYDVGSSIGYYNWRKNED